MGIRVIKTALAALLAIYLAQYLQLSSALSAGLLAVLGVDVTKKKGLESVTARLLASILGLLLGSALFAVFGFQVWVIAVFIVVTYPVLSKLKLQDGIVTSTVIMIHLFTARQVTLPLLWNEVLLLTVGLGTATVINLLYMPKAYRNLEEAKEGTEAAFSSIFEHLARHLRDPDQIWNGQEIIRAGDSIRDGLSHARTASENSLFQQQEEWPRYFAMRSLQLESIQRMLGLVSQVHESLPHGQSIAALFEELSGDVRSEYYAGNVERKLDELERDFQRMPLPETRPEFEVRSALLQLCLELRTYLSVAKARKKPRREEAEQPDAGKGRRA
ncbi:aromatic acid exporter family protein [Paenibacillus aurantius]|uniref:Aromatic acid exporter family protein n=1 Tax=Paenibacillus aurantius TaxID=2918900 RepID=A0AA96RD97_9BACL|nr:aromatic acid exporter family protein [Paenibacillus aurantius]WNQ09176.1 aromatic acid exporter family protein [Paenibacillus aurantius]